MTAERPVCIQIGALGGQGGGVLADWLAEAARLAGYPAQATSIPGVAQRTGATTYYFELFPERAAAGAPVFSLFPDADGLDLMAALEPTEAGRALENGLITARTTVITSRQRIYSTAEKSVAGDGTIPAQSIIDGLRNSSNKLIEIDMKEAAARVGGQANAVMFGAIAASGVLPLSEDEFRAAIQARGIAVASNLAGFETGLDLARNPPPPARQPGMDYDPAPAAFEDAVAALPETLHPLVGHALARLVDYQDEAYARLYMERLRPVLAIDFRPDLALAREVAKRLAAWMTVEDIIRVAQLKSRPGRLARIRRELGIGDEDPLTVTDFLKPGPAEFAALMPPWLGRLVAKLPDPRLGGGFALRLPTTTAWGFAALKVLASLRPWRRRTFGYAEEDAALQRWLEATLAAAEHDADLALDTARLAVWARGYGGVRRRGLAQLEHLFTNWKGRLAGDCEALAAEVRASLAAARDDPDGDIKAAA